MGGLLDIEIMEGILDDGFQDDAESEGYKRVFRQRES